MKKVISITLIICMLFSFAPVIFAEKIPTANIKATLIGDSVPVAGEKFAIAISIEEISSGLFVNGEDN